MKETLIRVQKCENVTMQCNYHAKCYCSSEISS